ncbi:MAG: hypothetical protein M1820_010476 [Bogoriella megaspora]|nr:MAG: hypothetical protein M1820_010476 [Bogoriella megaspora]
MQKAAGSKSISNDQVAQMPVEFDAAEEGRVRRKLDRHMMPIFFVLCGYLSNKRLASCRDTNEIINTDMLAFLDRSNIGNAKIAGMSKDLHLSGHQYSWLLTIFYITYVVFEFSLLFWKVFPPHIVGATVVFGWGLIATVQSAAQNWGGMMATRFLLGAFEAAYGPGIIYLLSFFYLRHEVGFRCGLFASAAPLASTFAGALAYGITSGHSKFPPWRLLFLVEGLATIVMIPFAWIFIPDSPEKARFLTEEETQVVRARTARQVGTAERARHLKTKEFILALVDFKVWFNALMYFSANVSYASLPLYLPTILADMGYSNINAQGLSASPYFTAFLFALITTWLADRTQQRGLVLVVTSIVGGIGYVVLATVKTVGVRYFATFLAAAGVFSTIPNILAWTLNNQGSDSRRGAGLVLINVIGQCGPILGTNLYPASQAPRYVEGMSVCAAFMFFTALLSIGLRTLLVWRNNKLDEQYGKQVTEDKAAIGAENYGPNFRYVL